nr:phospholipase-like protein [Tanacetum cinerariifolium]
MPCEKEDIAFEVSDNEDEQEVVADTILEGGEMHDKNSQRKKDNVSNKDKDQEEGEINENSAENSFPSRPLGFESHLRKPPSSPMADSTAAEGQQNAAPDAAGVTKAAPAGSDQNSRTGSNKSEGRGEQHGFPDAGKEDSVSKSFKISKKEPSVGFSILQRLEEAIVFDGQPITGIDIANAIVGPTFAELYDDDDVGLCCLGILQLVLLAAESRRNVPEWLLRIANDRVAWNKYPWGSYVWPTLYSQLRNTNVRRWGPIYVDQPTNEDDPTTYSIFEYTWAFKTWILESFRVNAIRYFDRFNRYPRVAAWSKKKGRLTPDDNEARSDWWISSRAYFDGFIDQVELVLFDLSRQNMYEIPSDIYRQFVGQKIELERNRKDVDDIKEQMLKFKEEMNARSV